jgi:hypothetical protein
MGSAISESRSALHARLLAAAYPVAEGRSVQVTYGPPGAREGQDVVAMLGVRNPDEEPKQLGNLNKEETFWLVVGVKAHWVAPPGETEAEQAEAVDARGFAIADVVRGVVGTTRSNLRLGPSYLAQVVSQETEGVQPAQGGGWVIFIQVIFECRARISGP